AVMQESEKKNLNLKAVVENIIENRCDTCDTTVTVDIPPGTRIAAHRMIEQGLTELIENAVEHNDSPEPVVRISAEKSNDRVKISIKDNGSGIPENEREVLEEGIETPLSHASGIGLWLSYWIIRDSGGSMEIRENQPSGSIIDVYLPKAD
ncbi:MAG: HAMP domain-containing sensor histidine kinase, partial [Halobacteria archaeon]|nr:HAMP domain-containing sensor histidine kinase [Halobacteria archaeon]